MKTEALVVFTNMFRGLMKPRIMTIAELDIKLSQSDVYQNMSRSTFLEYIANFVKTHQLTKVKRNLYVNNLVVPKVSKNEVARYLRDGAVVSFHSALSHAGVINNPSSIITSSVPVPKNGWNGGFNCIDQNNYGEFWFFRMPVDKVYPPGLSKDFYMAQDVSYPMANGEKALLDWIYVASSNKFRRNDTFSSLPPMDIDYASMNKTKLNRIAKAMGVYDAMLDWVDAKKAYDASENVRLNSSADLGF